jgi:hypothetical protein
MSAASPVAAKMGRHQERGLRAAFWSAWMSLLGPQDEADGKVRETTYRLDDLREGV